jgi:hypothetical protein
MLALADQCFLLAAASVDPSWTDVAGVSILAAQLFVLAVAAILGGRQVAEARRLREQQARPFVVIDLEIGNTIAEFVITNIGSTLAQDVQFKFAPPLESSWDSEAGRTPLAETRLFSSGIPTLPPGKKVVALFDQLPTRSQREMPEDYEVRVSYSDPFDKRYEETMSVGYGYRRDTLRRTRRDIEDVVKHLKEVADELKKWTAHGGGVARHEPGRP